MRRGGCPVAGRCPGGQGLPDLFLCHVTAPDLQEDGHDPPHHPPEEGIRPDVDRHERPLPPDPDRVNGSDRRAVPDHHPEGAEVVPADEGLPGSLHRGSVERDPHPERMTLAERTVRPVPDGVAVLPIPRRATGVEPRLRPSDVADRDVRRELAVERRLELRSGHPTGEGECDHLIQRMHSGVRAAGPIDRLADPVSEAGQRGFEFPLDGPDPGPLGLEAGVVRAVIFNPGAIPTSGRRLGGALSGP